MSILYLLIFRDLDPFSILFSEFFFVAFSALVFVYLSFHECGRHRWLGLRIYSAGSLYHFAELCNVTTEEDTGGRVCRDYMVNSMLWGGGRETELLLYDIYGDWALWIYSGEEDTRRY